jgi:dipeptidase
MKHGEFVLLFLASACLSMCFGDAVACTSILVTKGASTDGSTMITYTCDGEFHPHLWYDAAADYEPGDTLKIEDWSGNVRGEIDQVEHTYAVVDMMNEHQLAIGETTFEGRDELRNPDGLLHYWDLIDLALKRAKTAREAIDVMTRLVAQYGYRSSGESFSIADPEEVWILEMIGPGPGGDGAIWVARRIPDGYISCHANKARIGEFPMDDPENCIYSDNVISFAVEHGYYDPESGKPFSFCDIYCPPSPERKRFCEARVWSVFTRAAPSLELASDYHRAVEGAEPYPLWIRPDDKLSVGDVMALMRDQYEGTEFDMTKGVDAGPYGTPKRWRPLVWEFDGERYGWERSVSTQQAAFSFVTQSRSRFPDPIGGVYWYGLDDTYTTCYLPLYCGINELPESFTVGNLKEFSWDSAWWVFNFVANFANLKYVHMIEDIKEVQEDIESNFLALQPTVEQTAAELYESDPELMVRYLTDYSVSQAEMVVDRWRKLGEHLICKYNDGYVKDEDGHVDNQGYPEEWLEKVVETRGGDFILPEVAEAAANRDTLLAWMSGSFTSAGQAGEDTSYFDIRLEMVPVWEDREDGPWLYVEQAVAGHEERPYRQRVYHLVARGDGYVESEVYTIPDAMRFAGDWHEPEPLSTLSPDSLEIREGCTVVIWRRVDDGSFEGRTIGRDCESDISGASYATSEVRVTVGVLETWDRGYDDQHNQVWGAEKGGYVFERVD